MARVLSPGGRLFALPLHPNHAPQSDEYARVEDAPPALHACLRRPHTTMLDCRLARVTGWTGAGRTSADINTVLDISERTVNSHPNPTNKSPWG